MPQHQLIEILCPTWNLDDRPVTDRGAQGCHVPLAAAVAERGIQGRLPQLHAQHRGEHGMVADGIGEAFSEGVALQLPQALASTQDSEHGHQQQIPGREPNPAPHPRIGDRPQIAGQVEIGCGRSAVEHKEVTIPSTSAHADSPGKAACD